MKLIKCHFFTKEIQYLGHILGIEGIKPVPAKTEAIRAMHPPVNPKQVRAFLVSCSEEFQGISFFYNYETQELTKVFTRSVQINAVLISPFT